MHIICAWCGSEWNTWCFYFQPPKPHTNPLCTLSPRAQSLSAAREWVQTKTFLRQLAMLHHRVHISATQAASIPVPVPAAPVPVPAHAWPLQAPAAITLLPQASVASRFTAIHGTAVFATMVRVDMSHGPYSLCGLLSPPLPACCHTSADFQYIFIGHQIVRDPTTNIVAKGTFYKVLQ